MSIKIYDKSGATPQEILLAGNSNVDQILNGTSKNAIANKAVYNALQDKVEKSVNDLLYYYTTSDTYNKAEVRQLIGAINTLTIEVVASLPTSDISTTTIYFLGPTSGKYDEYVYVNNTWVKIGDTEVDLSDYLEIADFNVTIADYYTKAEIDLMIAGYYNKTQVDTALAAKQDVLTFDTVPTSGSSNPITSGGVYNALQAADEDIWEVMGKNGAKNLAKNEATNASQQNITFTVNSDKSISAATTAAVSATWSYRIGKFPMKAGTYILSDGNTGDYSSTCFLQLVNETETAALAENKTNHSVSFTLASDQTVILRLFYIQDATFSYTFYPMIRLAEDPDNTYQPYSMTNQQITPIAQAVSNPNLLDNPWFTVNQRGVTNDWTTQFSFGVDRWRKQTANNTLQVTSNGISPTTSSTLGLYQVFEQSTLKDLYGKMLTFSILYGDGTIESGSDILPSDHYSPSATKVKKFVSDTTRCNYIQTESYTNGNINIVFNTKADTVIKAVKLELGSASTLNRDTAPNYATELLKCQRYFFRLKNRNVPYRGIVGCALASSTNSIQLPITLPTEMRSATPSITVNNISGLKLNDGTNEVTATSVSPNSTFSNIRTLNILSAGNLTAGKIYNAIFEADIDVSIDFSADL